MADAGVALPGAGLDVTAGVDTVGASAPLDAMGVASGTATGGGASTTGGDGSTTCSHRDKRTHK